MALAVGLLCLAIPAAYTPALRADFLTYDDNKYVTQNPVVQGGLRADGVAWAFTTIHDANWIPLVWLSLMLDHDLYGPDPAGYHATNVLLHVLSTLLLLWALQHLTGSFWPSLFVAGVFALHPLHVQSVAWISERKDTLSGLFWMATLVAYARYVERPGFGRYALMAVSFALGFLCKATAVTLPFVLLLLDYWPADRLRRASPAGAPRWRTGLWLLAEKGPLLAMSALASLVTLSVQGSAGAIHGERFDLSERVANALLSYAIYLRKALWPADLSFFYPHTETPLLSAPVAGAALLLVCLSAACVTLALRSRRFAPLLVGWLWYLGTLVPMIGLVQVGAQSMADRYTYLPLVGLAIAVAWGAREAAASLGARAGSVLAVAGVAVLGLCAAGTAVQAGYWRDSEQLFARAIELDPDNAIAQYEMARFLNSRQRYEEAERHAREALRRVPGWSDAYLNLGVALLGQGRADEAVVAHRRAVARAGSSLEARLLLSSALITAGRYEEARTELRHVLELAPTHLGARLSLGSVEQQLGDRRAALGEFQAVWSAAPATSEGALAAALLVSGVDEWDAAPREWVRAARGAAEALASVQPEEFGPLARRLAQREADAAEEVR